MWRSLIPSSIQARQMANRLLTMISLPCSRTHAHVGSNAVSVIYTRWSAQWKLASFTHVLSWTFADITCDAQTAILASWSTRRCNKYNFLNFVSRRVHFRFWGPWFSHKETLGIYQRERKMRSFLSAGKRGDPSNDEFDLIGERASEIWLDSAKVLKRLGSLANARQKCYGKNEKSSYHQNNCCLCFFFSMGRKSL